MRDPVYLVIEEINRGIDYKVMEGWPSLSEARTVADEYARKNPGVTYVIAPIGQAVTAEIATRWDE